MLPVILEEQARFMQQFYEEDPRLTEFTSIMEGEDFQEYYVLN